MKFLQIKLQKKFSNICPETSFCQLVVGNGYIHKLKISKIYIARPRFFIKGIYVYMYIYVCMFVYMYIYVYIYVLYIYMIIYMYSYKYTYKL
jgi:hypothetical protein